MSNTIRIGGKTWLERRVVRTGVSPMNPKVKWAELDCGHDVYRTRKPRLGALVVCVQCSSESERGPDRMT
jgi:hypothetical protein